MSLAIGILLIFVGSMLVWVAAHGTDATTPWGVFTEILAQLERS